MGEGKEIGSMSPVLVEMKTALNGSEGVYRTTVDAVGFEPIAAELIPAFLPRDAGINITKPGAEIRGNALKLKAGVKKGIFPAVPVALDFTNDGSGQLTFVNHSIPDALGKILMLIINVGRNKGGLSKFEGSFDKYIRQELMDPNAKMAEKLNEQIKLTEGAVNTVSVYCKDGQITFEVYSSRYTEIQAEKQAAQSKAYTDAQQRKAEELARKAAVPAPPKPAPPRPDNKLEPGGKKNKILMVDSDELGKKSGDHFAQQDVEKVGLTPVSMRPFDSQELLLTQIESVTELIFPDKDKVSVRWDSERRRVIIGGSDGVEVLTYGKDQWMGRETECGDPSSPAVWVRTRLEGGGFRYYRMTYDSMRRKLIVESDEKVLAERDYSDEKLSESNNNPQNLREIKRVFGSTLAGVDLKKGKIHATTGNFINGKATSSNEYAAVKVGDVISFNDAPVGVRIKSMTLETIEIEYVVGVKQLDEAILKASQGPAETPVIGEQVSDTGLILRQDLPVQDGHVISEEKKMPAPEPEPEELEPGWLRSEPEPAPGMTSMAASAPNPVASTQPQPRSAKPQAPENEAQARTLQEEQNFEEGEVVVDGDGYIVISPDGGLFFTPLDAEINETWQKVEVRINEDGNLQVVMPLSEQGKGDARFYGQNPRRRIMITDKEAIFIRNGNNQWFGVELKMGDQKKWMLVENQSSGVFKLTQDVLLPVEKMADPAEIYLEVQKDGMVDVKIFASGEDPGRANEHICIYHPEMQGIFNLNFSKNKILLSQEDHEREIDWKKREQIEFSGVPLVIMFGKTGGGWGVRVEKAIKKESEMADVPENAKIPQDFGKSIRNFYNRLGASPILRDLMKDIGPTMTEISAWVALSNPEIMAQNSILLVTLLSLSNFWDANLNFLFSSSRSRNFKIFLKEYFGSMTPVRLIKGRKDLLNGRKETPEACFTKGTIVGFPVGIAAGLFTQVGLMPEIKDRIFKQVVYRWFIPRALNQLFSTAHKFFDKNNNPESAENFRLGFQRGIRAGALGGMFGGEYMRQILMEFNFNDFMTKPIDLHQSTAAPATATAASTQMEPTQAQATQPIIPAPTQISDLPTPMAALTEVIASATSAVQDFMHLIGMGGAEIHLNEPLKLTDLQNIFNGYHRLSAEQMQFAEQQGWVKQLGYFHALDVNHDGVVDYLIYEKGNTVLVRSGNDTFGRPSWINDESVFSVQYTLDQLELTLNQVGEMK